MFLLFWFRKQFDFPYDFNWFGRIFRIGHQFEFVCFFSSLGKSFDEKNKNNFNIEKKKKKKLIMKWKKFSFIPEWFKHFFFLPHLPSAFHYAFSSKTFYDKLLIFISVVNCKEFFIFLRIFNLLFAHLLSARVTMRGGGKRKCLIHFLWVIF